MRLDEQDDPLASAVLSKENDCPKCGKDNLAIYQDGHQHCFTQGCGYHKPAIGEAERGTGLRQDGFKINTKKAAVQMDLIPASEMFAPTATYRGLKTTTLKKFEYSKARYGKAKHEVDVWPIYAQDGSIWGQRIRHLDKKDFTVLKAEDAQGTINETQPFGKSVWGDANDRRVIVVGGEIDTMSVAQCTSFKYPVVSSNSGEGATPAMLKANYKWFDRFDEIILWLDDDDAGRAAMQECAPLFAIGKVKITKVTGFKDANDALTAGKMAEIEQAVFAATLWVPRGIINAADLKHEMEDDEPTKFWRIPIPGLQAMTGGLMRAGVSYWVAGTGVGKTTLLQETLVDIKQHPELSTEEPAHIGYLGFEDLRRTILLDLMSIVARKRLKIDPVPKSERLRLFDLLFGDRMFELFDVENAEWTFKAIISYLRYMVKALGVNIAVLDPLTFLAAMLAVGENQTQALDNVSQQLAALSKELNCHIAVAHHLTRPKEGPGHEEGGRVSLNQVRGSGGIANFASLVVGAERNGQHENTDAQTITLWRVLKNRQLGITGVAAYTQYDRATGRTYEIPVAEAQNLLGGKGKSNKDSQFHEFATDDEGGDF